MAITLTSTAVERIKAFMEQRGKGEGVRLAVRPSGCSGMAYVIEFADMLEETDMVFEEDGARLVVDKKSMIYLDGTELDYTKEGLNEGFKFNNPNVTAECGCGESFTVGK